MAVGDPQLAAVQHILVALLVRAQPHRDHVRPGAGLGHRQRADMLAGDQSGQVALLLLRRAPAMDLVDAEVGVGAVGQADRGRGAADLLHRDAMGEIAHVGAAVLLLDRDAMKPQFAHGRPQVDRELVLLIDLRGARRDLLGREAAHGVAQHVDVRPQAVIQVDGVLGRHCWFLLPLGRGPGYSARLLKYKHTFFSGDSQLWKRDCTNEWTPVLLLS